MVKKIFFFSALLYLASMDAALARGGGGGSSGGGGGGGSFGGGYNSVGSGGTAGVINFVYVLLTIIAVLVFAVLVFIVRKRKIQKTKNLIQAAASQDKAWDEVEIRNKATDVFMRFQKDWSDFNVESMKNYTAPDFYKKMVLELNVLKNQKRRNLVNDPKIKKLTIWEAQDQLDNTKDEFKVEIIAQAEDVLMDEAADQVLYTDKSIFVEYWVFRRSGNDWLLSRIDQATANVGLLEKSLKGFAENNNFFFDPDFGWLMMPNKGAIFNQTDFMTSDINNHVIGYFREKIVEFYTYIPYSKGENYVVAQAILPISYNDILVKKKGGFSLFKPLGLRKIETESNDFNKKFDLWADPQDQVSSFELLTPNFMEKIYALPFELNIEVVGNVLYFYSKKRQNNDYDQMLEILSWAFDEMRM